MGFNLEIKKKKIVSINNTITFDIENFWKFYWFHIRPTQFSSFNLNIKKKKSMKVYIEITFVLWKKMKIKYLFI